MNNLLLTNSLTRKKEIFKPINPKKISLYACGPTVYDSPHVGNARSLVVFDVLYRILKVLYRSTVTYVRNITDADDKIIEASHKNKMSIEEITKKITNIEVNHQERFEGRSNYDLKKLLTDDLLNIKAIKSFHLKLFLHVAEGHLRQLFFQRAF